MGLTKTWFITGASRGFGRVWTEAALRRGDTVVATARDTAALASLVDSYGAAVLPVALDVTDRAAVFAAVARGHEVFGQLDIALSNAGYGHGGTVEELSEAEARAQLDTNFFGSLWVAQAALPIMRAQQSGHILAVSSIGGIVAFPTFGIYNASKYALEGLFDAMAQEVSGFGIKATLIEPGTYATDFSTARSAKGSAPLPAYDAIRDATRAAGSQMQPGDPAATIPALMAVIDSAEPPLRLALGASTLPFVRHVYQQRLDGWQQWEDVSVKAQGETSSSARLEGQGTCR